MEKFLELNNPIRFTRFRRFDGVAFCENGYFFSSEIYCFAAFFRVLRRLYGGRVCSVSSLLDRLSTYIDLFNIDENLICSHFLASRSLYSEFLCDEFYFDSDDFMSRANFWINGTPHVYVFFLVRAIASCHGYTFTLSQFHSVCSFLDCIPDWLE